MLPEEFISQCLQESGVVTVRRRRLPLESLVMVVLGMALYRGKDVWSIADKMQIALLGRWELVAPSAVVQGRQRLGSEAMRQVFHQTQQLWHQDALNTQAGVVCNYLGLMVLSGALLTRQRIPKLLPNLSPPQANPRGQWSEWFAKWS